MKPLSIIFFTLTFAVTIPFAHSKGLVIDTYLFSDVDDAGALLLAATSPDMDLLAVNGRSNLPIGIPRPLTNATFFDSWFYELGEYASKVAFHFSGGTLPWGRAEDAWDPVALYRKSLAEAEDGSVTIVSIGFLDNLSALLNSTANIYSNFTGLVVMGGGYPSGRSWNFWGSNASPTAHAINSWEGRVVFLGDDVGKDVLCGAPLMSQGPEDDPVRMAYIYYSYYNPRPSWDPLTVLYAIYGLGGLFEFGSEYGCNHVERDGTNRWVWDEEVRNPTFPEAQGG
ncbi:hypothetical protein C8A03DRAFT_36357 [Achaetomium macrosporum]|uniref:Inosine/uridine-preferring nucleoside hydrolase domain-containing protein n=1 Tax=Achaetomium macrosporum TaxID=79813 RepID=A0AAN7C5V2_9PEZI|nr:hypothetical protein C8A03DRAFT_36357 [Achaetomium macrosporum]